MTPRSDPQCASVMHMVPAHSPVTILGRYVCFNDSDPKASMALQADIVSAGIMLKAWLALQGISPTKAPMMADEP